MRLRGALLVMLLAVPGLAAGGDCTFPAFTCPVSPGYADVNCDGKDALHCQTYDVDGAAFGDCQRDGIRDDFWTIYDGNFDGTTNVCDPSDTVIEQPDGNPDGSSAHPLCDRCLLDRSHILNSIVFFADDPTYFQVGGPPGSQGDLVRGTVSQIAVLADRLSLGPVTCLAEDMPGSDEIVDAVTPPSGEAFFYLSRWNHPFCPAAGPPAYGYWNCLERLVPEYATDCVP
ncbi:MAG: hypothetical protein PVF68_01430 [Acidobacteriota bacterium]